jgi:hypothetical protein
MEKVSSFDKLVVQGYAADSSLEALRIDLGRAKMAEGGKPMEGEKKKTPAQLEICALMNVLTNNLRAEYGLLPFNVPVENIHVFGNNLHLEDGLEIGGMFDAPGQLALVRECRSNTEFADYLAHELIHFKSFGAVQLPSDGDNLDYHYRAGFAAHNRDGSRHFFHDVDEALTEEMAKRLVESLKASHHRLFEDETEETLRVQAEHRSNPNFSTDIVIARHLEDSHPMRDRYKVMGTPYPYQEEREILNSLIDKIFERNRQKFAKREEVFNLFAKGKLQGNFLGIGKVIEQTFGRGSFRKIGELSSLEDAAEYRDYVKTLVD